MAENKFVVYAALAGNTVVMVSKFVVAAMSGSASMLAEGFHSVADTSDSVFLLLGQKRSKKPPDELHPFGHGKELYFWAMIVSLMILGAGGVASIMEGIMRVKKPEPLSDPKWNYVVLGVSFVMEGLTCAYAFYQFHKGRKPGEGYWEAYKTAKDPTVFMVLFEDSAALVGLIFAFCGVYFSHHLQKPQLDGVASICIGALLLVVGGFLIHEVKHLIIGERVDTDLLDSIRKHVENEDAVAHLGDVRTMHFSPDDAMAILDVEFRPELRVLEVAQAIERIENSIRKDHQEMKRLAIEPRVSREATENTPVA